LLTILDKSNYLKGLLILAKKDNQLRESEKNIIRDAAKRLGFSKDFYEETLQNLMRNDYILDNPIIFSDKEIAKMFISEGLELANSDDEIVEKEMNWIKSTAQANQIPEDWLNSILKKTTSIKAA
jgi:uncharacterized tellurite resistance protein B-like protein